MTRLNHAWRALQPEQRLAVLAALGLFASMFLPWYSKTYTVVVHSPAKTAATSLSATETSLSAFQAFSFVEAAVLLVSAGVLAMLFARAEGRLFQLPGGDGPIVMVAGGWTALLVFYRLLDKPALHGTERITATVGVEWGIFIALLLALGLLYAGGRIRTLERPEAPMRRAPGSRTRAPAAAHPAVDSDLALTVPEPAHRRHARPAHNRLLAEDPAATVEPILTDEPPSARERAPLRNPAAASGRPRYPPAPPESSPEGEQLSFEDPPTPSE
jgi:hypothetical protein